MQVLPLQARPMPESISTARNKMDIENALDQITDWQSENEAATKVQLLVSELTSDIATSKDALGAYGQINEFRSSTGLQSVS